MFNVNGKWAKKLITIRNEMNTFRRFHVYVYANDKCQWNGVACVMRYALSNIWNFTKYLINDFCWAFGNMNMWKLRRKREYTCISLWLSVLGLFTSNERCSLNIRTKQGVYAEESNGRTNSYIEKRLLNVPCSSVNWYFKRNTPSFQCRM